MDKEKRSFPCTIEIEQRADGKDSRTITGYALKYDKWSSDLGWFKEIIRAGAVDDSTLEGDIVATFNHNFDFIQGRTSSGTLRLTPNNQGLKYSFEAPNTTAGNDLIENIRNGNVKGSSFIFTIKEDRWKFSQNQDELDEREILKFERIFELGPVVMPAYPDTTAAKRSHDETLEAEKQKEFHEREPETPDTTPLRRHRRINLKLKLVKQ